MLRIGQGICEHVLIIFLEELGKMEDEVQITSTQKEPVEFTLHPVGKKKKESKQVFNSETTKILLH